MMRRNWRRVVRIARGNNANPYIPGFEEWFLSVPGIPPFFSVIFHENCPGQLPRDFWAARTETRDVVLKILVLWYYLLKTRYLCALTAKFKAEIRTFWMINTKIRGKSVIFWLVFHWILWNALRGKAKKNPRPVSSYLTHILTQRCDQPHSRGLNTLCCGWSHLYVMWVRCRKDSNI